MRDVRRDRAGPRGRTGVGRAVVSLQEGHGQGAAGNRSRLHRTGTVSSGFEGN